VFPGGNCIGMDMIVRVARKRDQHCVDIVAVEYLSRVVVGLGTPASRSFDNAFPTLAVLALGVADGQNLSAGELEHAPQQRCATIADSNHPNANRV
jgi:hypothetical protein